MITGLHHVTAISAKAQATYDFYTNVLGLRLVKRTLNFDDPTTYELYFGNANGSPGTLLTFYTWEGASRGQKGTGQATGFSFAVPENSLSYWYERARKLGVELDRPSRSFGQDCITLADPDGLRIQMVATGPSNVAEHAISGLHSVMMDEEGFESTANLLTGSLGLRLSDTNGNRFRFAAGDSGPQTYIDVMCLPAGQRGEAGAGCIHHFALSACKESGLGMIRAKVADAGFNVTPVLDRTYFRCFYFREPGGVLFEIATDGPGFAIDEPLAELGSSLKLPRRYEPMRRRIESVLPALFTTPIRV